MWCKEHTVAHVLLDDTLCIATHKVGKAILCLTRDWCDECGVHESRCLLYVSNIVDDASLVEIMCATCATVTSRRDYMRLMCILVEIIDWISTRILFPHRRRIVSTKSSNNNDAGRDDADQSKNCHPITSKVVSINHCSRRENGFCCECRITGLGQEVYGCCASSQGVTSSTNSILESESSQERHIS